MYKFIESSEPLEYSLPIVGANILSIIIDSNGRMTIFKLFERVHKLYPNYGDNRINQSLMFLFSIAAIEFNEPYIEVIYDNH
jgi:hypothetical protein